MERDLLNRSHFVALVSGAWLLAGMGNASATPADVLIALDVGGGRTPGSTALHPAFRINAVSNTVLSAAESARALTHRRVRRSPDYVRIADRVAVVMGVETSMEADTAWRYTHIYVRSDDRWLLAARHEAVIVLSRSAEYAIEPPSPETNTPPLATAALPQNLAEAELLTAAEESTRVMFANDAAAMAARMHPDYLVSTPEFRVYDRAGIAALFAARRIASERFERTPEYLAVEGDLGVVMGREMVLPLPGTRSAPIQTHRRYSMFYLHGPDGWLQLARQANVVRPAT
jgi:hypothetical protein